MPDVPDELGLPGEAISDAEASTPAAASRVRISKRRRWIFRALALLAPFLLLGGAELICRWRGFGGYPPIVVDVGVDGPRHWYATSRPGIDSFFYQKRSHTGGIREWQFITPKTPGVVRIVMLGGSAMQGYAQPRALTNGYFLEAMLADAWNDDRTPEVLNLGGTAMASYPAIHILEAILPHQPDLVIVMSGNNEFYGAYGVASLHSSGASTAGMHAMRWFRGLGLAQWLESRVKPVVPAEEARSRTLMERVVVNEQIRPDDPIRQAAASTIRNHLDLIVNRCRRAGIPVIVCTVPTNERDLAPIGKDAMPQLPDPELEEFNRKLVQAREAIASNAPEAEQLLRDAIALDDQHATARYLLGRTLTRLGRHDEALAQYVLAVDLDSMPWRAVSAVNDAARAAADDGGVLCDMQAAFRAKSPGGAIGWDLMDDHVHMSLEGQALFARSILETMCELPEPLRVDRARLDALPDRQAYARRLGYCAQTDLVVATRVAKLFAIPFMRHNNETASVRWSTRRDALQRQMTEVDRRAVEAWHDPGLHVSNHRPLSFVTGHYRMMEGDDAGAAQMFEVARRSVAPMSLWRLQLDWYLIKCHRQMYTAPTEQDKRLCREAIEVGEALKRFSGFPDPSGPSYLGMVYHVVGNYRASIAYLDDAVRYARGWEGWDVVYALADSLVRTGQMDRARRLLDLAQQDPAMAAPAREMLNRMDQAAPQP